ncbi:MAG: DUF4976 domain-containing protein, partial [Verrucomicrobiae bacterium]|nr:DUF4976 domain-containing protein [Verrucomicrobiae bacterium]
SLDLAPSLLDFAGAKSLRGIPGRSWKRLAEGRGGAIHDAFLYEYNYEKQFPYTPNVRAVRTDEWKLIRYPHGDGSPDRFTAELYHLAEDPHELRNRIGDPSLAGIRRKLERELERQSRRAGPESMPVYEGIVNVLPKY